MAARLNRNHSESVLKRIKTSQLVNRLQSHALGTLRGPSSADHPEGQVIEMSKAQVSAAVFLIERTLAKAEAPKIVNLNGTLTLTELIAQASKPAPENKNAGE